MLARPILDARRCGFSCLVAATHHRDRSLGSKRSGAGWPEWREDSHYRGHLWTAADLLFYSANTVYGLFSASHLNFAQKRGHFKVGEMAASSLILWLGVPSKGAGAMKGPLGGLGHRKGTPAVAPLAALGDSLRERDFFAPRRHAGKRERKTGEHEPQEHLRDCLVSMLAGCRSRGQVTRRLRPEAAWAAAWGCRPWAEQSPLWGSSPSFPVNRSGSGRGAPPGLRFGGWG
jgi:hypothetical protein